VRLAHQAVGQGGRGTVLLHGFLGSGRNLRSLASRLVEADASRTVLCVDLPGHGDSPPLSGEETLRSMAVSVLETARAAGLRGPLELVGHSLGGRVALAAADMAEAEVEAVALLDITPSPLEPTQSASVAVMQKWLRAPEAAPDRKAMREAMLGAGLSAPIVEWLLMNLRSDEGGGVRWRVDRAALGALQQRVNPEVLWDVVEKQAVRLLCIRGDRSPYVADADVRRLEALGVEVATVESGHDVHVEALGPVATLLRRWL
jgi:esterase